MKRPDRVNTGEKDFGHVAAGQKNYYRKLFEKHRYSPQAVASAKQIYKELRYQKLSQVFGDNQDFSLHDVGMGLGHYYEYLKSKFPDRRIVYSGSEIVKEFSEYCKQHYPECEFFLRNISEEICSDQYDYLVFGGTFYHPCESSRSDWERFMFQLLRRAFSMARKGIAFNVITQYCDFYEKGLYYCNLSKVLDFITDELSRFFVIDHAYPLYEMTIMIYRQELLQQQYPQSEYKKYFPGFEK